jgi:hypothetical protein
MSNQRIQKQCNCTALREEGPFSGWDDYDAFSKLVTQSPLLRAVPVKTPYANVGLLEQWYQCSLCQSVWRLVEPDPPFRGLWEKVTLSS